jgi:hypothetical protein
MPEGIAFLADPSTVGDIASGRLGCHVLPFPVTSRSCFRRRVGTLLHPRKSDLDRRSIGTALDVELSVGLFTKR